MTLRQVLIYPYCCRLFLMAPLFLLNFFFFFCFWKIAKLDSPKSLYFKKEIWINFMWLWVQMHYFWHHQSLSFALAVNMPQFTVIGMTCICFPFAVLQVPVALLALLLELKELPPHVELLSQLVWSSCRSSLWKRARWCQKVHISYFTWGIQHILVSALAIWWILACWICSKNVKPLIGFNYI